MKYFWIFIIVLFFSILYLFHNCRQHTYRSEIKGSVYDIETHLPVRGAEIIFIQDTFTIGARYGTRNMNEGKRYTTNKYGIFKIPQIRRKYWNDSPLLSDLSWMITVSCKHYATDTIDLRNWKEVNNKPALDTIWLKPNTPINEFVSK